MKIRNSTVLTALVLAGCAGPTVNLSTPEPVKVDISMRLDVYQHQKEEKPGQPAAATNPGPDRLNRAADIQTFKNSRLIGESASALLSIRVEPAGEEGDYLQKIVDAENASRMALMKEQSARDKIPLPAVQKKQADLARKMAFKGEWIEVEKADGTLEWVPKEG
ncbi:MAG: DUF1318 domain-containing protein [Verrucomicrobia bacterium]|nr:DUF1318 domain-containing protein [Verrucomicrobiota bacterium]